MKLSVFTDGACTNNGKPGAKASYAYWFPENPSLSFADKVPSDEPQTNNRGELLAIEKAIDKVIESFDASDIKIHIYTDSDYSRKCLTLWIPGWVRKNWKTAEGKPVANRDLIERISSKLLQFESFAITHVKAHTSGEDELSKNNHIVDRMAVAVLEGKKEEEIKEVRTDGIDGCPLQMMGPPISEATLVSWLKNNMDKLDESAVNVALIQALTKTYKKNGFEIVKQKLHRTSQYRLISSKHIIKEINKTE